MSTELSPDALGWRCDPDALGFATTDELEDLQEIPGQERASDALTFALDMERQGYNVFALGPEDAGMHDSVRRALEARAEARPAPSDWCYLANFGKPHRPLALRLPAGKGAKFRADMRQFVNDLRDALAAAFESDDYRTQRQVLEEEFKDTQEEAIETVSEEARRRSLTIMRSPLGFAVAPAREGRPLPKETFEKLPEEERERIKSEIAEVEGLLHEKLRAIPVHAKELREKMRKLNDDTAKYAIGFLFDQLRERYSDFREIVAYLKLLQDDVTANIETIIGAQNGGKETGGGEGSSDREQLLRRYHVNLLVDNSDLTGAPVVYEDEPSFDRLLGRVEHRARMGTLVTDHHLIRPGALHRANGGYLILDARKVLTRPMVWEALKRVLRAGEVRIESLHEALGHVTTITLEPEPIALDAKVVLIGGRLLYYLLAAADPEFGHLFKVAADFDDRMMRDRESQRLYARLIAKLARSDRLAPFTSAAVGRVMEYSARLAGDSERLSARVETIADVLREADHWARKSGGEKVTPEAVDQAIDARIKRLDRVRERALEAIETGLVAIDTDGSAVGQVNGLSVLTVGEFAFGRPTRITARIRLGSGKVMDIEREVELGGPIHSKGFLILNGFISARYLNDEPLSLQASLVFEQSYSGVEGDSASLAETCALLSAISQAPIRQQFAVTGSIDQHGGVQAIGGVNEKIEGFFDVCASRGLTGGQGVIVPHSNIRHLMLEDRVVDAVREGKFHIHGVRTVDEALEVLTGVPAGAAQEEGGFPPDSLNARIEERLRYLNRKRRAFAVREFGETEE
ncbi:MAG: Lon protease family protein [Alphaproteobacteria bacterium]